MPWVAVLPQCLQGRWNFGMYNVDQKSGITKVQTCVMPDFYAVMHC